MHKPQKKEEKFKKRSLPHFLKLLKSKEGDELDKHFKNLREEQPHLHFTSAPNVPTLVFSSLLHNLIILPVLSTPLHHVTGVVVVVWESSRGNAPRLRGSPCSAQAPHQPFDLPTSVHSHLPRVLPLENEEITQEAGRSHPSFGQMVTEFRHSQQPRVNVAPAAAKNSDITASASVQKAPVTNPHPNMTFSSPPAAGL